MTVDPIIPAKLTESQCVLLRVSDRLIVNLAKCEKILWCEQREGTFASFQGYRGELLVWPINDEYWDSIKLALVTDASYLDISNVAQNRPVMLQKTPSIMMPIGGNVRGVTIEGDRIGCIQEVLTSGSPKNTRGVNTGLIDTLVISSSMNFQSVTGQDSWYIIASCWRTKDRRIMAIDKMLKKVFIVVTSKREGREQKNKLSPLLNNQRDS